MRNMNSNRNALPEEIYKLYDRKTGNFIGIFSLHISTSISDNLDGYSNDHDLNAELTIKINCIIKDQCYSGFNDAISVFHSSYRNLKSAGIESRASISTHRTFDTGGIELYPENIRGHRVGGLVMSKIITWLKTFPLDSTVTGIHFAPSGNKAAVRRFYESIGMPINGDSTTIGKLTVNSSWEQNIKHTSSLILKNEIDELSAEITHGKRQLELLEPLKKKILDIELSFSFLVAFKSYHIEPNLLSDFENDSIFYSKNIEMTFEELAKTHICKASELEKIQYKIKNILILVSEFNMNNSPKHRWKNLVSTAKRSAFIHREFLCKVFFILILLLFFYSWIKS